ncbi:MAG: quinolinate synthase NadA [Candidatus Sericytochromatia bacterium]|nr:quinolinate synthase NadA [Candidatus Tanganyikabacteria bacterium]
MDLVAEIARLKKERNAVILAHYYQDPDIQDVADFLGDSLALSQRAAATDADVILFCGVHFMAETAKLLNPDKVVLMPDLSAGCSLADSAPADRFEAWVRQHPGAHVVSYINCSAAVKALSDVICTSSNAVRVVETIPRGTEILFAPDQHLGRHVMKQTKREMTLWPGSCQVHEIFSEKRIVQLKIQYPEAVVVAHPECEEAVLAHADYIGSTSALLEYAVKSPAAELIVATEAGIIHQMQKRAPAKVFIPAPPNNGCACNECPHMRVQTLEKAYLALRDMVPEVTVDPDVAARALKPVRRMLDLSRPAAPAVA